MPSHIFPNGKRWIVDDCGVQWRLIGGSRRPMRIKAHGDKTYCGGYYCHTPAQGIRELAAGNYISVSRGAEIILGEV